MGRDFPEAGTSPSFIDRLFAKTMAIELGLLRKISLPFGVALFAVAKKTVPALAM
jgi:hypothetical protein